MSSFIIKTIAANGDVVDRVIIGNQWGFAPIIWGAVCKHILKVNEFDWNDSKIAQQVWDVARDTKVPAYWRVAVMATFDRYIIDPDEFERCAQDLTDFVCEARIEVNRSNHIPAVIWELRKGYMTRGMCFRCSSVSEDAWGVSEDAWVVDLGKDNYRPYNIDKDKGLPLISRGKTAVVGHRFIYKEL